MEFFRKVTTIDFMRARWVTAIVSAVLFIASFSIIAIHGLNLGLDFTGGVQFEVTYQQPADLGQMRSELSAAGFPDNEVKTYGSTRDILVTLPPMKTGVNQADQQQLQTQVMSALQGAQFQSLNIIGAEVGQELFTKGALALFVSMLATLIYIAFRFEWRFGLSAILALVHDPILILGVFSLFHIQFDLVALAALLTVIGRSLNDTIVIFDRVRENFRKLRKGTPLEIMNLSINQTLSRTIMTSGLTMLAVLALLIYGGPALFGFSLALLIGIIIGTYSSIYVAGALAIAFGLQRANFIPKKREEIDETP